MEECHGGGQAAVRQERWQYVGIAGSSSTAMPASCLLSSSKL